MARRGVMQRLRAKRAALLPELGGAVALGERFALLFIPAARERSLSV